MYLLYNINIDDFSVRYCQKKKWAISSNGLVVHPVTAASATPFDDRTMTPTEPTEPVESRVKKWYSPSLLAQALYRSYALLPHKCISTHFGSNQRLLQMILWIMSSCPCQSMTNLTRYSARKRIFAHFLGNKCKDRLSNHSTKAYPESWGLPPIHFDLLGHNTHPRRRRNHCRIGPHDGEFDRWLYGLAGCSSLNYGIVLVLTHPHMLDRTAANAEALRSSLSSSQKCCQRAIL